MVSCGSSQRLIRCTRAQESSTQNTHTIQIYPLLNSEQLCKIFEHSGRGGICKDGVEGTYFSESSHLRRAGLGRGGFCFLVFFPGLIKSSSFYSKWWDKGWKSLSRDKEKEKALMAKGGSRKMKYYWSKSI